MSDTYTEILPDEKKTSATVFLERALVFFERHGVNVVSKRCEGVAGDGLYGHAEWISWPVADGAGDAET